MIETEGALIDAIGGNTAVAELLHVKHNTVSGWRTRGFPPWTHSKLREAAGMAGVSYDPQLFEISPRGKAVAQFSAGALTSAPAPSEAA